jgi:hypothetical protein
VEDVRVVFDDEELGHHVLLFTRTRIAWSVDPIPPELQLSTPVYVQEMGGVGEQETRPT